MRVIFIISILLFLYSCDSVDSNYNDKFSIQTEKSSYQVNNTTSISTIITNKLGKEVKIYNTSCGGPYFILEKYDEKNWIMFSELPMCERLPAEPKRLNDGESITVNVNLSLMQNVVLGLYRMKFIIKGSVDNLTIEDKYLYSNQFSFVQ